VLRECRWVGSSREEVAGRRSGVREMSKANEQPREKETREKDKPK
jgi:hypothetical protein